MEKKEPRLKELDPKELPVCVEEYASYYFTENKDGILRYTPYYEKIGFIVIWAKYFLSGVTFEQTDNIYELVVTDEELITLYCEFLKSNTSITTEIQTYCDAIVDFRKQQVIHSHSRTDNMIIEILEKESRRIDAEIETLKQMEDLSKAQRIQTENANQINAHFSVNEQVELTKKMAQCNYNPDEIANCLAQKLVTVEKS